MDLVKLKHFKAVIDTQSFTKAGEEYFLSRSAMRKSVTALETELAVKLIKVEGKKIIPTPEGGFLRERCTDLLNQCAETIRDLHSFDPSMGGGFHFNSTPAMMNLYLADLLTHFNRSYKFVDFKTSSTITTPDMTIESVNAALRSIIEHPSLYNHYVCTFNMGLYASQAYVDTYGLPEKIEDIKDHVVIYQGSQAQTYRRFDMHHDAFRLIPHRKMYVAASEMVYRLVKCGCGMGVVSQRGLRDCEIDLIRILPEIPDSQIDVYLNYRKVDHNTPQINFLRQELDKIFAEDKLSPS